MRFSVLGPLVLVGEADETVTVTAARQRVLLAALLLHANTPVSAETLAELVWDGAPPPGAAVTLRTYVKRLRRALGPAAGRLVARDPGYLIELRQSELDVLEFEELSRDTGAAARGHAWAKASETASQALALWRGEPLVDVPSRELREPWVARLKQLRLQTLEWRIEADLHLGHDDELVPELGELTAQHPLREHLYALLMLALARRGRQAEALAVYQSARRSLIGELGIEPGAELRRLQERVLAGDPTLAAAPPRARDDAPSEAGREPSPVPRQLPVAIPHFTGRADALKALSELAGQAGDAAAGTVVISAIDGTAGIGKTALAVHWGHLHADQFPDGQLYVNLRGFDPAGRPAEPGEAVRGFLDALGVPASKAPTGVEAQVGMYRSLLAGKRALVVLDNARDADQVRPLLPGGSTCLVLVTSRSRLAGLVAAEGAHPLTVDLLTLDEARELLIRRLGTVRAVREPDAVNELIHLSARLPLALNIVAARAALRPDYPLGALAGELRDARDRLAGLDIGDTAADPRAVFSWSYRTLDPATARMFRLLGVHPGPDISVSAAAGLAATGRDQARGALHELTHAHLLTEQVPGRFAFHDLLRAYAIDRAEIQDSAEARREALHRVLDHYLHTARAATLAVNPNGEPVVLSAPRPGALVEPQADDKQAMAWLNAEHPALLAAVAHAAETGFDDHACRLAWALVSFLSRRGHWRDIAATQQVALAAAERLGDLTEQARAHRALGRAQAFFGSYDDAHAHLQAALTLYQQLADDHGQANIHSGLAWVFEMQDRLHEALDQAQQALAVSVAIQNRVGQARNLGAVGWYHGLLGEYVQALACCQQALALHKDLNDELGEANTWDSIGYAHHHLRHHSQALTCYQRALDLYRKNGEVYLEGVILTHAADTHEATGDAAAARDALQQALTVFEGLQHHDAGPLRARLESLDTARQHAV